MVLKDDSTDSFGHVRLSGVGEWLAKEIEKRTGKEARTTVLGHVQRGGTPTRVRPLAGHPLRPARHRRGARRGLGQDGGAARHGHRPRPARRGHRKSSRPSTRRSTPRPRSSSADRLMQTECARGLRRTRPSSAASGSPRASRLPRSHARQQFCHQRSPRSASAPTPGGTAPRRSRARAARAPRRSPGRGSAPRRAVASSVGRRVVAARREGVVEADASPAARTTRSSPARPGTARPCARSPAPVPPRAARGRGTPPAAAPAGAPAASSAASAAQQPHLRVGRIARVARARARAPRAPRAPAPPARSPGSS